MYAPSLHAHEPTTQREFDEDRLAVALAYEFEREVSDGDLVVGLLLPAVATQALPEVAVVVEQSDGDERESEVACTLQVVAREYAEAARIERQRVVNAELRAEVCDRVRLSYLARSLGGPSLRARAHVRVEGVGDAAHALDVDGVGRHAHQAVLRNLFEEAACVVLANVPDLLVEVAEDGGAVGVPAPP